jgi:hypothetical protein
MHGKGMLKYASGNYYEGLFVNNKPHGNGMMKYNDGKIYEGEW